MYQQIKYLDDSYLTKDHRFLIIARKRWIILVYDNIKNNYSDLKCALYADRQLTRYRDSDESHIMSSLKTILFRDCPY